MFEQLKRVVFTLCEDMGTTRALAVKLLVQHEEWAQLQQLSIKPSDYTDSESLFRDLVVTEFLRKCKLPSGIDTRGVAIAAFWDCEAQNRRTNDRLSRFVKNRELLLDSNDVRISSFFDEVRREIAALLGRLPDHLTPRFSGGATTADIGMLTTIPDKMSHRPACYPNSLHICEPFWAQTGWFRSLCEERPWATRIDIHRGNSFFTVPKDGQKDRGCCKEAPLPVCFQLDVGRLMRARLKRWDIDLQSGQETHRQLSRKASIDGSLATIDLSSASDTISRFLVELLLPVKWYELLDALRAHETYIKGRWVKLEKFSSMGNGFTFELETLIFAGLARVIALHYGHDPDTVKVYGDDIIVPTEICEDLISVLRFCGLTTNERKTFTVGRFRESCGGDFYGGVSVRAHYLKEPPHEPQHWISLANGLRRLAYGDNEAPTALCDSRWHLLRRSWARCIGLIPANIRRCVGPTSLGDTVIHDHEAKWDVRKHKDDTDGTWDCTTVRAYCPVPRIKVWNHWTPLTRLAASLVMTECQNGVTPRGAIAGYRIRWVTLPGSTWLP